jgi:hypothetical protein
LDGLERGWDSLSRRADVGKLTEKSAGRLREWERFFDLWTPEMAWCLGVLHECGSVFEDYSIAVCSRDFDLLRAVRSLLKESRFAPGGRELRIDSPYLGLRLVELGMEPKGCFHVSRVPTIPEDHVKFVIRGVLDGQGVVPYSSEPGDPWVSLQTSRKAVARFIEKTLRSRGYRIRRESLDINMRGLWEGGPDWSYGMRLTELSDIIDCYNWLYVDEIKSLRYNVAQTWYWSGLERQLKALGAARAILEREPSILDKLAETVARGKPGVSSNHPKRS